MSGPVTITKLAAGSTFGRRPNFIPELLGALPYASLGWDTTPVAGTCYFRNIYVDMDVILSGAGLINGTAVAGNVIVSLWDQNGVFMASSALAGTAVSGPNLPQFVTFSALVAIRGPGKFHVGVQFDNVANRFRTIAANSFLDAETGTVVGAFGTIPSITAPSTFTANEGPFMYLT